MDVSSSGKLNHLAMFTQLGRYGYLSDGAGCNYYYSSHPSRLAHHYYDGQAIHGSCTLMDYQMLNAENSAHPQTVCLLRGANRQDKQFAGPTHHVINTVLHGRPTHNLHGARLIHCLQSVSALTGLDGLIPTTGLVLSYLISVVASSRCLLILLDRELV
ncbi:hypothetical protein J6590_005258 [Homalodisca vitripennis]|nr:hypothetical protein J6590_005258 [Homalodisca vitripennis]